MAQMSNVSTLASLPVCVSVQIALFQQFPQLKACVRPAVEKAVQELLMPVVDRSIKIALTTTEHIVKKVTSNFSLFTIHSGYEKIVLDLILLDM